MEFKLPIQEINEKLKSFYSKKLKENKVYVSRASKNDLMAMAAIIRDIREKGLPEYFVIRKLEGKLGHGVFLHPEAKPILEGEVIAPYSGEVYLSRQNNDDDSDYAFALIADLRLSKKEQLLLDPRGRYHPRRLYSLDLDAEKKGNFTRFINHSDKPNVEAELVKIPAHFLGLSRASFELVYFARKTIRPGEQLLVSYEGEAESYWGAMKIKPFPMTPKTFRLNASLKVIG